MQVPPRTAEVKERVEVYLYSASGPSWPVLGRTLPLPLPSPVYIFAFRYSQVIIARALHDRNDKVEGI
jgi:hypothetical protein